ncbi:MAG: flagellar motor switch protein FliG [Nitrospirae bacterium]|nr:MAG: flagellar motor switch protein FliG [Nitrospirota bacterium]
MAQLSGIEKAAVFISYLGDDIASEVFRHLDRRTVQRVSLAMTETKPMSLKQLQSVLDEVKTKMKEDKIFVGGKGFVQKVLAKAMGEEEARKLLHTSEKKSSIERLSDLDGKLLVSFLKDEHPQTIAFILALLEPKKSAEVLNLLPQQLREDVIMRIVNMERVPEDALNEIDNVISNQMNLTGIGGASLDGKKKMAEILNNSSKEVSEMLVELLENKAPETAEKVKSLMFVFEDLINVDDRGIQTILKEVSTSELALALKTASEELKEKIFRNMSKRAAEMLKDEMEVMGPVKVSDVEKAQENIVKVARKLEEEGKIILAGKGSEALIV